jgi:3-dehydrosphinganine reductase
MAKRTFADKSVLITGGSSGIGLALARQLVVQGAHVCLLARDVQKLENARQQLETLRVNAQQRIAVLAADVSDNASLSPVLSNWIAADGVPDVLINSAGVARPGYFEELTEEIFRWMMDVNYHGTVNTIRCVLPGMIARKSGQIINFSSIAGVIGVFGYTAYGGSKYAVRGFSDALRAEMKPKGIRVSIVFPPDTDTPQLAWEDQFKPFETRSISGTAKPISADKVAAAVLKAAARGKYAIAPGFEAGYMYFAGTRLGGLIYPIMDAMVRSAQKKKPGN